MANCKICGRATASLGTAKIFNKYFAEFRSCLSCGFIQAEEPLWLDEAYSKSITDSDTGLVQRNIFYSQISYPFIRFVFGHTGKYVDFGGGYGLFTRLMRDKGLDFFWHDKYSPNIFANGYDANPGMKYDLLTAFEVFEHLNDPRQELLKMLSFSSSILFSTELIPTPQPKLEEWWYYGLEHGQHISFFSRKSLQILAENYGLYFYSKWDKLHFFTKRKIDPLVFRISTSPKTAKVLSLL